jgi:glutamate-1-semialdehyde 2,1-aminomutase
LARGEYLDYGMSVSACILGYADPIVNEAVREQLDRGVAFSLNHPAELELAELLCETIPCAEMVRYAKGGGEACALAVRIARGATGRDIVLFCGYHGWHDWYLAANLVEPGALDVHLLPAIEPTGVPRALAGTAIPFPYGDLAALETSLARHRGRVACVIMEPMRSALPPAGYLERVRELTHDAGTVLIFDEVTTGFRHGVRGVEEVLGVAPDMAVLAKSLANGFAMGAVVGRRKVMEPAARMFVSSTNWSELVGIVAALATLREIRRRDVPRLLGDYGERLIAGFNAVAAEVGVDVRMQGLCAVPQIAFSAGADAELGHQLAALFAQEMCRRGVLIHAHPTHSAAHGDEDLALTLGAARESLVVLRDAIRAGRVDEVLEVTLERPIFRRLVT